MLSWAMKYLADTPGAQSQLRQALHTRFADARAAGRNPTVQEITSNQIPWLEATIEESLRCSATAPTIDRVAKVDTQILGYRIPKGVVVSQPCSGPSITTPAFDIDEAMRSPTSLVARRDGDLVPSNWPREGISVWNPERWLVRGSSGQLEFNPKAGPQVAFGLGTRGCYGKRLTYVESRIWITLLVWNFEFLPLGAPDLAVYCQDDNGQRAERLLRSSARVECKGCGLVQNSRTCAKVLTVLFSINSIDHQVSYMPRL